MNGDDGFFDDDSIDEGKFIENLFGKNKNNNKDKSIFPFPNFTEELTKNFIDSGFSNDVSFIASISVLSALSPDYKVEALTYKPGEEEVRTTLYPLNLYLLVFGDAGSGKSTILQKMQEIYSIVSPLKMDNVVEAKSSSMGLIKNIKDEWNYTLLFGDDADWILDPELKDGTIIDALLRFWNSNKLGRVLQSHESTNPKKSTVSMWLGVHKLEQLNRDQIENGLMRRMLAYHMIKKVNKVKYVGEAKRTRKNLWTLPEINLLENMKQFVNGYIKPHIQKDTYQIYENYIIGLASSPGVDNVMFKIFDRVEDYGEKKPRFMESVIRSYPEILQRVAAIYSLWNGEMIVKIPDEEEQRLNMVVLDSRLKEMDKILWKIFIEYYDELENVKFGMREIPEEDLSKKVIDMKEFALRTGKSDGTDFICPLWVIRRHYSIDINRIKKIIETGVNTETFSVVKAKPPTGKKGIYLISKTDTIINYIKTNGFSEVTPIKTDIIMNIAF